MFDKYLILMGWKNHWGKWDRIEVAIDVALFTFTLGILVIVGKVIG